MRRREFITLLGGAAATLTQPAARTNIRSEATSLMGRAAEIAALNEAIKRWHIVTLVGKKGVGKTRIAVAAAQHFSAPQHVSTPQHFQAPQHAAAAHVQAPARQPVPRATADPVHWPT